MIVLSLFVEFDKIDATKSSFCRFLSKLTKTLLYGSTWQKVGAVFVTFCRFLSIFVTNFPSEPRSNLFNRLEQIRLNTSVLHGYDVYRGIKLVTLDNKLDVGIFEDEKEINYKVMYENLQKENEELKNKLKLLEPVKSVLL